MFQQVLTFETMKIPFQKELANLKVPSLLPSKKPQDGEGKNLPQAPAKRSAFQLPPTKTPFDAYQRSKLIRLLNLGGMVPNRSLLEVGCGMGDLLIEAAKYKPREIYGVDGHADLIEKAKEYTAHLGADVSVADVRDLPFPEKSFDVVLVMYELQHLYDKRELLKVIEEVKRVCRQYVILVELTSPERIEKEGLTLHPVDYYKEKFKEKGDKFHLRKFEHLHTKASGYVFTSGSNPWHWIRWIFSPLLYLMGFPRSIMRMPSGNEKLPDSELAMKLQEWSLPMIMGLDDIFRAEEGTTVMWFERERLFKRG